MRPGPQRRSEGAADERRHDPDVLLRDVEDVGDLLAVVIHPLRLVIEREVLALPVGDGDVRLDRVVMLARVDIGRLDPHRRRLPARHRRCRARPRPAGRPSPSPRWAGVRGRYRTPSCASDRLVFDLDQIGGVGRLLQRLGDDERDRLAVELHLRVLQHMQLLARLGIHLRTLRHLLVGQAAARSRGSGRPARRAPAPPPPCRCARCARAGSC